ncbi:HesB/YadR/YfhF family protein [Saliterribacillus persicus]|uniref:Uncharacterized protein YneR n=1 Tax=Saliterribacillus persicus TaxID=930114 RepID=A0A368YF37_9BACI|nr:HesB/YadR/YfhF family protein [Saliterribacillus persicus]RCW76794.1 uncharacterized protein YneR [Saliterribacillus persicus]
MEMTITQPAAKWYMNELSLKKGDAVRFYVRYGGHGGVQSGFSLALSVDTPDKPAMQVKEMGITFFVEETDLWYFDNQNFHIKFSRKNEEVEFIIAN